MKKPKITNGKWEINKKGVVYHWGYGPESKNYRPCIAKVSLWEGTGNGEPTEEAKANSKAISAVPEMINALVEARKAIQSTVEDEFGVGVLTNSKGEEQVYFLKHELLQNIEQALEKAGVEL